MPYIKQEDRKKFVLKTADFPTNKSLETLGCLGELCGNAGDLNYAFTMICNAYLDRKGLKYQTFNDLIASLEYVKSNQMFDLQCANDAIFVVKTADFPMNKSLDLLDFVGKACENNNDLAFAFDGIAKAYYQSGTGDVSTTNVIHELDAIGALEGAKMELYRRQCAPYEDLKIQENGDVL